MVAILPPPVYVLKIELEHSNPLIFRRVKISSGVTLDDLHEVIQVAMGWDDYHLHQFIVNKVFYGNLDQFDGVFESEMQNESESTLRTLAPKKGSKMKYEYDFGDSWMHLITVEQVIVNEPDFRGAVCLEGENACPPEDVGGIWNYFVMVEALNDRTHESHHEFREWLGSKFNPSAFYLKKVNTLLKKLHI